MLSYRYHGNYHYFYYIARLCVVQYKYYNTVPCLVCFPVVFGFRAHWGLELHLSSMAYHYRIKQMKSQIKQSRAKNPRLYRRANHAELK